MLETYSLEQFTVLWVFQLLLIFCRVGSAMMLVPGVGEIYVSPTIRLLFSITLSMLLLPILSPSLPQPPNDALATSILLISEIITGIFIGMMVRMMLSLMHVAGMVIVFQSSLASAMLFDINQGNQGSVVGSFMTILALTVIFTSGLHHSFLLAVTESYKIFSVGSFPPVGEFSEAAAKMVSHGFLVGIKIAAPVITVTLIIYLVAGIMTRLMPNMQVFFVMIPIQITVAFLLLMITIPVAVMWYVEYYQEAISFFDPTKK